MVFVDLDLASGTGVGVIMSGCSWRIGYHGVGDVFRAGIV